MRIRLQPVVKLGHGEGLFWTVSAEKAANPVSGRSNWAVPAAGRTWGGLFPVPAAFPPAAGRKDVTSVSPVHASPSAASGPLGGRRLRPRPLPSPPERKNAADPLRARRVVFSFPSAHTPRRSPSSQVSVGDSRAVKTRDRSSGYLFWWNLKRISPFSSSQTISILPLGWLMA